MCDIYFELIFEREKKEKSVKGPKVVKKDVKKDAK